MDTREWRMCSIIEAMKAGDKVTVQKLLPTGRSYLSIPETKELLELVFSERMDLEVAKMIASRGTICGSVVQMAIAYDYPVTYFWEKGKRITAQMLLDALEMEEEPCNALKSLLDLGANPKVQKNDPLKKAVKKRNWIAVQLLLSYGADPNAISKKARKKLEDECRSGETGAALTLMSLKGGQCPLPLEFE